MRVVLVRRRLQYFLAAAREASQPKNLGVVFDVRCAAAAAPVPPTPPPARTHARTHALTHALTHSRTHALYPPAYSGALVPTFGAFYSRAQPGDGHDACAGA